MRNILLKRVKNICISLEEAESISEENDYQTIPGLYKDFRDGKVYQNKINGQNKITLVWHIDGAPTIKSKNLKIWTMTAFIVELPTKSRYSIKNILLCGLWYGPSDPNFELFQLFERSTALDPVATRQKTKHRFERF